MYIQYQFTDIYYDIMPYGIINSYSLNLNDKYIYFNATPVINNTSIYYELYYEKDKSLISSICSKLEYSFKNTPISTILNDSINTNYTELNFTLELNESEVGFIFIKTKNINKTFNYTYFYDEVDITNDATLMIVLLFVVLFIFIIGVVVVLYIIIKQGNCCSKEKNEENRNPSSISLINRMSE